MQNPSLRLGILAVALAAIAIDLWSQTAEVNARDSVVDLMLQTAEVPINLTAYSPDVRVELQKYLQRYKAYQPNRPRPVKPGLEAMVYSVWVAYERKLVAASDDPKAPALAAAYLDYLRPCYEWEGFHGCPEREASFAVDYLATNSGGPFSDYLPLLAAHRWLCASEAYAYENNSDGAVRSRRKYEVMISRARYSKAPLIRFAAERLAERNSCFAPH
jgi:hypothetical protein